MQASWSVRIAGRDCAAGLTWVPLIGTSDKAVRKEFKQTLRKSGAKCGVLHAPKGARYPLAGIVRQSKKSRSLERRTPIALWFAASVTRPTLVISQVDGGYWLLLADENGLDPRGDVYATSSSVNSVISELYTSYVQINVDLDIVLTPGAVPFGNVLDSLAPYRMAALESLLTSTPPKQRVAKVIGLPSWTGVAGAVLGVLGIVAYGGNAAMDKYRERQAAREAEDIAASQLLQTAEQQMQQKRHAAEAAQRRLGSYTTTPAPGDMATVCIDAWARSPKLIGGWVLEAMDCDAAGRVDLTYVLPEQSRGGTATEMSFREGAKAFGMEATVDWFMTSGRVSAKVDPAPRRIAPPLEQLPTVVQTGQLLSSLAQHAQRALPDTQLRATKPEPVEAVANHASASGTAAPAAATAPFLVGRLTMSGKGLRHLPKLLINAPTMSIDRISIKQDANGLTWSAEGPFVTATTS